MKGITKEQFIETYLPSIIKNRFGLGSKSIDGQFEQDVDLLLQAEREAQIGIQSERIDEIYNILYEQGLDRNERLSIVGNKVNEFKQEVDKKYNSFAKAIRED